MVRFPAKKCQMLNASASISASTWELLNPRRSMQLPRQPTTQVPHPWQRPSLILAARRSALVTGSVMVSSSMAPNGQTLTHKPHAAVALADMRDHRLGKKLGLREQPGDLDAAPDACATVSGISFAHWHSQR